MRKIYLRCADCDNVMSESETGSAVGDYLPSWEKIAVCNNCGSDNLDEVGKCDVCDEAYSPKRDSTVKNTDSVEFALNTGRDRELQGSTDRA